MTSRLVLALSLAAALSTAGQDSFPAAERIVAVGDVHGDYEQFTAVLKSAGIVGAKGRWVAGRTHLVQLGDVPDRGPNPRKVFDLLMRLEAQAKKAGGRVHALIGNHEAMNIYGDLRYATAENYGEFRDSRSEALRQAYLDHILESRKDQPDNEAFREQWLDEHPLGFIEQRLAYSKKGKYGKWIRNHNAVVKIGDTLFLHGGISPKYVSVSLAEVNERVRSELDLELPPEDGIVRDEAGPLWYRGLAQENGAAMEAHVARVLEAFQVQRIVIGHTPTGNSIVSRIGGRVIVADVGLSLVYGGPRACLLIEGGAAYTLEEGKKVALPPPAPLAHAASAGR